MEIVRAAGLTPRWSIFRANEPAFARWTYGYVYGPHEEPDFPHDATVRNADVNVKLFSLAPNAIQPPHMHEEDIIFAVVSGQARFLAGINGEPVGMAGPRDVVFVGKGEYYGSVNTGPEIFSAFIIRLPRTQRYHAPYNVFFPQTPPSGEDPVQVPSRPTSEADRRPSQ